jgi:hypothetical protein
MKYLRKYNESLYKDHQFIKSEIEDILLDFSDNGHVVSFSLYPNETIWIYLGLEDSNKLIKLADHRYTLEHLISYLENQGYKLDNGSYFINNDLDKIISCANCGSYEVDVFNDGDSAQCNGCGYNADILDFDSSNIYPLPLLSDLKNLIKSEDSSVEYMFLSFKYE